MGFKNDKFPASEAFDTISSALSNESDRAEAIKKGGCIFGFTLKNKAGETASWHIDLKETGKVGTGTAPEGQKATVTLVLSDEDFAKLAAGKGQAQQMFMSGKLKIRGDMMKATRLEPVFKKMQNSPKL